MTNTTPQCGTKVDQKTKVSNDRFFLPKKVEYQFSNVSKEPEKWYAIVIPHELLEVLQELGKDFGSILGAKPGNDFDQSSREHLLQYFFIICQNIPSNSKETWVLVLNKLFMMGKFCIVKKPDQNLQEDLEKVLLKAELCGRYITPAILNWLQFWLDPSIHAEVIGRHLAFRHRNVGVNISIPCK